MIEYLGIVYTQMNSSWTYYVNGSRHRIDLSPLFPRIYKIAQPPFGPIGSHNQRGVHPHPGRLVQSCWPSKLHSIADYFVL
jgi:hypothetical protein